MKNLLIGPSLKDHSFFAGKALMRVLSPGGDTGLSILIFHRVLASKDPLFPEEIDRDEFDRQIGFLRACFNIMPLIDAVRHLRAGTLPPRAACITFDDGYADNAEIALPVLQAHQVPATFFVATGFLDGGRMWNDTVIEVVRNTLGVSIDATAIGLGLHRVRTIEERQKAIRSLIGLLKYLPFEERMEKIDMLCALEIIPMRTDLMMTSAQVKQLHRAGMTIGGHTVHHPILARLQASEAEKEIGEGKEKLEEIIGAPVPLFAYPNGKPNVDYLSEHVEIVKSLGFEGAVSTSWGFCKSSENLYQLPRFTPWDRSRTRFTLRLARNALNKAVTV